MRSGVLVRCVMCGEKRLCVLAASLSCLLSLLLALCWIFHDYLVAACMAMQSEG
jgi:hypothetical protein